MTEVHALTVAEALKSQEVSPETGLTAPQVSHRRRRYGANLLRRADRFAVWPILVHQLRSIIVWLLAAAAGLAFLFGKGTEGAAIVVILTLNTALGFVMELRAMRSMEALRRLSLVPAKVRREGRVAEISAQDLVPGDIVILEAGDVVTADLRLIEAANLQCDESPLTGESVPVAKDIDPVPADRPLHARTSMAFKGTAIAGGSGEGVVVATGMSSELGRIAALVETAESERSPLEARLDRLGGQLVWATLALAAVITGLGVSAGRDVLLMVTTAVALAVAAVPEGLPVVATMALARGMWRMARRNALIERLSAVETLGATTVVLVDKTGTLTENRMSVVKVVADDGTVEVATGGPLNRDTFFATAGNAVEPETHGSLRLALELGVLCNNAALSTEGEQKAEARGVGDPLELALLAAGIKAGITRSALLSALPEIREEAFSTATKMMATFHRQRDAHLVAVKGAPEEVLAHCTQVLTKEGPVALDAKRREEWLRRSENAAGEGLRLIALATKTAMSQSSDPYDDLTFVALAGLLDPLRPDVARAVADCRNAGVKVVMLTGDHAATARKIALDAGLGDGEAPAVVELRGIPDPARIGEEERKQLLSAKVFARISPDAKLALVSLYQAGGDIVAMTGDGVNDAPALKKADIGIAMGQRGTQVAREAAAMVLKDDSFPSIVAAMHQGRVIFTNIRKFVVYLMSCNLAEIMIIGLATLSGLPLPLLPLQILYLNLVTDVFPAFALGVGEGDAEVMRRPPRDPDEPIVGATQWSEIGAYAGLITVATLAAFVLALEWLDHGAQEAVTVSFLTLSLAQLWHVLNMSAWRSPVLVNEVTRNPFVWGALALCVGLIVLATHLPGLSSLLGLSVPGPETWILAIAASLSPVLAVQTARFLTAARRPGPKQHR
ncbi:MAG: cation-transporting P-type ATPase [Alphaproteobacteria bacterium]|nr:cation-transporting P-type ATPase [Alphaproteobacteria bacterium]